MPHVISGYLDLGDIDSKMKVYAVDLENGNYLGAESEIDPESGYFYLEFPEARNDVLIIAAQNLDPWRSGTNHKIGDLIYLKNLKDLVLEVTQSGTSGSSEPSVPTLGESVTDGTVEYIAVNHLRPQSVLLKNTIEV